MEQGHSTESTVAAFNAYAAALKRGSSPTESLAAVDAGRGVDKEGTAYASQLVTRLNQERWKDGGAVRLCLPLILNLRVSDRNKLSGIIRGGLRRAGGAAPPVRVGVWLVLLRRRLGPIERLFSRPGLW